MASLTNVTIEPPEPPFSISFSPLLTEALVAHLDSGGHFSTMKRDYIGL